MAGTPKSISMVKQILHLHGLGYGIKTISRELGVSKNTIKRYLRQAESRGLAPEAVSSHSNEALEHILLEDNTRGRDKLTQLRQFFPDISSKLEETGFTLHYLWCKVSRLLWAYANIGKEYLSLQVYPIMGQQFR